MSAQSERIRRFAATALVASAIVLATATAGRAEVPYSDRVPANAGVVLSIPDSAAFWQKLSALPPVQTVKMFLGSPQMQQNLDYQELELERAKLAEKLGFPVTFEELMGNVFKDGTLFLNLGGGGAPTGGMILGVRDAEKAGKLIDSVNAVWEENAREAADGSVKFEKVSVGSVEASHASWRNVNSGAMLEGYYAMTDGRLIYAANRQAFLQCTGQETPAEGVLAGDAAVATLMDLLPWRESQVLGWINGGALLQGMGIPSLDALGGANLGVTGQEKMAVAAAIDAAAVTTRFSTDADPAMASPNVTPGILGGAGMLPEKPLLAVGSRSYDATKTYHDLATALNDPMLGMMMGNTGGASPLANVEAFLGISIANDLLPALDNELIFAIDNLNVNMMMPMMSSIDMVAGSKLRDAAKMRETMLKIEKAIDRQMGMMMGGAGGDPSQPAPSMFSAFDYQGTAVRGMSQMPPLTPHYAIADDWFVLGMSPQSVVAALERRNEAKASLTASAPYRAMQQAAGDNPQYEVSYLDLAKLTTTVVQPLLIQLGGYQGGQPPIPDIAMQLLGHLDYASGIQYQQNGNLVGQMKLQMR
jgi:hypothetical protein